MSVIYHILKPSQASTEETMSNLKKNKSAENLRVGKAGG